MAIAMLPDVTSDQSMHDPQKTIKAGIVRNRVKNIRLAFRRFTAHAACSNTERIHRMVKNPTIAMNLL
jgi:hypothetical protein